jgi:hypothetical protein
LIVAVDTKYYSGQALVNFVFYTNGRRCLRLVDPDTYEPLLTATINLPDVDLPEGHVIIKDYAENEGVVPSLIKAGIIGPSLQVVPVGYVKATIHQLLAG